MIYIVIPTYNEKENIGELIKKIYSLNINNLRILVIDDNSPDNTADVVKSMKEKYLVEIIQRPGKMGLGSAYITGFKYAI